MAENKRVPGNADAVDRARDVKESHGETWTDVFEFYAEHRDADHHSELTATVRPKVDTDALDEVAERVDDALSEAGIDESEIARRVTDDLVSQLPPAIAEELEGRR